MEEERNQGQSVVSGEEGREVEVKDRGLFDFMGKKEEKEKEKEKSEEEEQADLVVAGMEKVRVDEEVEDKKEEKEEEKKKKEGFFEKLHRSHSSSSSSSSSSDEEEGGGEGEKKEEEEKKKKKKGLKEKIKEKFEPEEGEEKEPVVVVVAEAQEEFVEAVPAAEDDTAVTVEVVEGTAKVDGAPEGGEKKGFLEKIKEKLPGHKKPSEEAAAAPTAETAPEYCAKESGDHAVHVVDANEGKENKKGFLGKIMEKLPGYGKGGEEKEKEKEKETEKTSACN